MYEAYKNSRNTLLLDILKPHHVFFSLFRQKGKYSRHRSKFNIYGRKKIIPGGRYTYFIRNTYLLLCVQNPIYSKNLLNLNHRSVSGGHCRLTLPYWFMYFMKGM